MQAENWGKVKKILREVLEFEPRKRCEFLDKVAITAEIRAEVESLLALEAESADFMSLPITDFSKDFVAEVEESEISLVGRKIGVYEITAELGFGGMGAIYLGERSDGKFSQRVAIKMLKREFNVEKIRRSFKRERQIQAKLNHPNIATLLDAGTTDDGIPYLVMEYVEGLPIDRFCEEKNLSLNSRLKLFNKVCEAVSFAHRNLIIHRDLKPSNIFVTAEGEPKLLDFGISKLLDAENSEEKTLVTAFGAMTPEYASPEQIKGETISTATDIYSLGVVLYKMLTGSLPYKFNGKTNGDFLKAITEDEPTAPSKSEPSALAGGSSVGTRISQARENPPANADGSDRSKLKGDLDNIILKALSKEPERRYQTVEQFSADLWRHIDGLPIFARRATVSYRAAKFLGRNKLAVIAAGLIFLSLIIGFAVSLRQTNLAREAQRLSAVETEKAKAEQAKSEKITKFMSKIIGYANPAWYAEGAKLKGQARVIDAIEDLRDKIETEFANEPDVAAEIHYKFAEVFHWVSKGESGERIAYFQQKRRFHAVRALELRVQFYGEWHEVVAKDLFGTYGVLGKTERERADLLMRAILMMRDTNPNNLNLPYMFEAYTANLIMPESAVVHEIFREAARPATDETKYQIAERYLREAILVWHLHYKPDHPVILAKECWLAYALAKQEKWTEFDEHYQICKQLESKQVIGVDDLKKDVELVEQVLAERNQPK